MRDNSPPEATFASGLCVCPGFAENRISTRSRQLAAGVLSASGGVDVLYLSAQALSAGDCCCRAIVSAAYLAEIPFNKPDRHEPRFGVSEIWVLLLILSFTQYCLAEPSRFIQARML